MFNDIYEFKRTSLQNLTSFITEGLEENEVDNRNIEERFICYKNELLESVKNYYKKNANDWKYLSEEEKENKIIDFNSIEIIEKINKLYFEIGMKAGTNITMQLILQDFSLYKI